MARSMSLVGLDVHASQTHAAILDMSSGELRGVKLRMAPSEVVEFLATLPGPVRAVYEAGPTGFGLARAGGARGIDVRVVAAGKVPRASGDRVKTDKRDAERLARLLAAGELRFAFVPSVADEQFRDVIRAIEDCRGDLMRARHRLSKLLLRRDLRWAGPGSTWTQAHLRWLRSLRFEDVCSQAVLVDYLSGVEMLVARRAALIAALEQVDPRQPPRPDDRAAALLARDRHAVCGRAVRRGRRLAPVPAQAAVRVSWGSSRPSTPPTESAARARSPRPGSIHARRLLVEAAHHYRHQPAVGDGLARRQAGQDPRVIEISWRAQRRLHQRWQVLRRPAPQARRRRRDRLRPRARRVLLGGRHPELSTTRHDRAPGAAGARARPTGLTLVATSSPRRDYGQPATHPVAGGARF